MSSVTTPHFEFVLSLPHDERFAGTVRDVAVHAAVHVGCPPSRAQAFGQAAEDLLRACLQDNPTRKDLPVVVRCTTGPLELLVDEQLITLDL